MNRALKAQLKKKFRMVQPAMTELAIRRWAGAEAHALGRGGVSWVAEATGLSRGTVQRGMKEVLSASASSTVTPTRSRRPGAGRKPMTEKDPGLQAALEALVSPETRGDPQSPLRWTTKTVRHLSQALGQQNHVVSPASVGRLLRIMGYSLQANAKTKEGSTHPDRDAQFRFINAQAQAFIKEGEPVISVDAKKKEVLGARAGPGREWERKGQPVEVLSHDFFMSDAPVAIPYGVYDVANNKGFVNVGTDHNTSTFAAFSIEKWWDREGHRLFPKAKKLFISADGGGSNSSKSHVFKLKLQAFADRSGLSIHVSHFPPGTSKWNVIEHRLFSFISLNWRGRPLTSYETIVSLIAATTTTKGLRVTAELDLSKYDLGVSVPKHLLHGLHLVRESFHGDWNYVIHPRTPLHHAAIAAAVAKPDSVSHAARNAKWKELIAQQLRSGLDGKSFCRQNSISYRGFAAARARLVGKIRRVGPSPT